MINAIEARNKAKIRLDEIVSSQLQKIETLVLNACEAGYFYASYDFVLKEETEKSLMDLGYNFKGDGDNKVIEWEFIDDDNPEQQEEEFFFSNDDEVVEEAGVDCSDTAAEVTVEDSVQDEAESSVEEVSGQDESEDFAEEVVPQNESEDSAEEVVPQDEIDDSAEEDTSQDETESFTFEDYSENKEDVVETADATETSVIE